MVDDFTNPPTDGMTVNRMVRREVQMGVDPDTLISTVINDFKLEHGLGDDDVLEARVVKKFRKEDNTGAWFVYYRVTGTLAPTQTVTVQFVNPQTLTPGDTPAPFLAVPVSIITSDGNPLVAPVSVDVRDLLTGSANNPVDYSMVTPQTLNWIIGDPDGTLKNAVLNTTGANTGGDPDVDLDLDNAAGAAEGAQNTHQVVLVTVVP